MNTNTLNCYAMNNESLKFNLGGTKSGGKETFDNEVKYPNVVKKLIDAAQILCQQELTNLQLTGGAALALQANVRPIHDFDFTTNHFTQVKKTMDELKNQADPQNILFQMNTADSRILKGYLALEKKRGKRSTGVPFSVTQRQNDPFNITDNSDLSSSLDVLHQLAVDHVELQQLLRDSGLQSNPDLNMTNSTSDVKDISTASATGIDGSVVSAMSDVDDSDVRIEGTSQLTLQNVKKFAYVKSGLIRRLGKCEHDAADFDAAMVILKAQGLDKKDEDALCARNALRNRIIAVADGIKDDMIRAVARNRICTSQAARLSP